MDVCCFAFGLNCHYFDFDIYLFIFSLLSWFAVEVFRIRYTLWQLNHLNQVTSRDRISSLKGSRKGGCRVDRRVVKETAFEVVWPCTEKR